MKYFKLFYYYNNINQREAYAITYIENIETTIKSNNRINKNSKILFNNYFDKFGNSTHI